MTESYKRWNVIQTVELSTPARDVWELVGGFYIIHHWHPDIEQTEVPNNQASMGAIRRILTFPGQPKTTEELISIDNSDFVYTYRWIAGEWGERVQQYAATIRVIRSDMDHGCIVQWSSTFLYSEDAVSEFYWNGFRSLKNRFG